MKLLSISSDYSTKRTPCEVQLLQLFSFYTSIYQFFRSDSKTNCIFKMTISLTYSDLFQVLPGFRKNFFGHFYDPFRQFRTKIFAFSLTLLSSRCLPYLQKIFHPLCYMRVELRGERVTAMHFRTDGCNSFVSPYFSRS
jgi:hypothetical protein